MDCTQYIFLAHPPLLLQLQCYSTKFCLQRQTGPGDAVVVVVLLLLLLLLVVVVVVLGAGAW